MAKKDKILHPCFKGTMPVGCKHLVIMGMSGVLCDAGPKELPQVCPILRKGIFDSEEGEDRA